jgi:hypothetical protein
MHDISNMPLRELVLPGEVGIQVIDQPHWFQALLGGAVSIVKDPCLPRLCLLQCFVCLKSLGT